MVTDAAEKQEFCRSGLDALTLRGPSLIPWAQNSGMVRISPAHTQRGFAADPLLKSHLYLFVWCLGLDAASTAGGSLPGAVEGVRTRNLGRRGLPGSC